MSTTDSAYVTHLYEWHPPRPELHESFIQADTVGHGKDLPPDFWSAGFRCVAKEG